MLGDHMGIPRTVVLFLPFLTASGCSCFAPLWPCNGQAGMMHDHASLLPARVIVLVCDSGALINDPNQGSAIMTVLLPSACLWCLKGSQPFFWM
jgi:hypothetical protein